MHYGAYLAVALFCGLCDLAGPSLFWNNWPLGTLREPLAFFALGGLLSQVGVLSVWCALGAQQLQWRFLLTIAGSTMVSGAFVLGLQLPDFPNSDMPTWVGVFVMVTGLVSFLISALIIKLISLLTKERIYRAGVEGDVLTGRSSYSIGYLIGLTTAVAFLLAMVRAVIPAEPGRQPPLQEMLSIIQLLVQHGVLTILILSSCVILVLRMRDNWHGVVWLCLLLIFALPIDLYLMSQQRLFRFNGEAVSFLLCFLVGFSLCSLALIALIRLTGYRLACRTA